MIKIENLHKHFGGFHAVDGATLEIESGTITGLIGPNGAGKTTLFNVIAGVLEPTSGIVFLDNENITGLPPHQLFDRGLLRTFQIAHEFHSMTCRENLMMVPSDQSGEKLWNTWFGRKRIANEERALRAKADEVLEFLTIDHLADHKAGQVSGGQKKLLELGRTMMVDARIVFLDEVGAGVNKTLLKKISKSIGNGISVDDWLGFAPQESLELFMFQSPRKAKKLYFDSIPKSTDEFIKYKKCLYE